MAALTNSLLSLVSDVCAEIGIPIPASLVSTTDIQQLQLNALAKAAQEELARRNWPQLIREYSFQTANGTQDYQVPSDFSRLLYNTAWDTTNLQDLVGQTTPQEWAWMVSNGSLNSIPRFRITGAGLYANTVPISTFKLHFTPIPTSIRNMTYLYVTKNTATTSGSSDHEYMTDNNDISYLPIPVIKRHLKWRYLKAKGLDYAEEFREAYRFEDQVYAQSWALPTFELGRNLQLETYLTGGRIPETGFGA